MPLRVENKIAIVTGGSRGIGEGCARALAAEGARVVIADQRVEDGERTAQSIKQSGGDAVFEKTDVLDQKSIEACVAATLRRYHALDILVNNAGTHFPHTIDSLTPERWDFLIDLNLKSMYLFCKAALPEIRKRKGAIVNMSSVNGRLAIPSIASYNASKGAIDQLTRVMALALADRGVRVNAVAPGTIATELARNAVLTSDDAKARIMSRTPMKRLGEPSEIADVCAFLLSDASSYVTGEIVVVDGGRMTLNYTVPV